MTVVYIWNNHELHVRHAWSGHASLSIDGAVPSDYRRRAPSHVSWVPEDDKELPDRRWYDPRRFSDPFRTQREGESLKNFFDDLLFEEYAPDHILQLASSESQRTAMMSEWTKLQNKYEGQFRSPSYKFLAKNCSTMVMRVLDAAFRSQLLGQAVATPLEVKRRALSLGAKPLEWKRYIELLARREVGLSGRLRRCLLAFQRRDAAHGSSNADARFGGDGPHKKNDLKELEAALRENANRFEGAWI